MVLFLNDIAGSEIMLILVFILMFFGSKSIPGIARTFGRTIRQVKEASQDLQNEIKKSGADIKKDMNFEGFLAKTEQEIKEPMEDITNQLNDTVSYNKSNYFLNREHHVKTDLPADQQMTDPTETPTEPEAPKE